MDGRRTAPLALVFALVSVCLYGGGGARYAVSTTETDMSFVKLCNETSPVSLLTVNAVLVHKRLNSGDEDGHFKCFLHCLFTKYGWMDREGGFLLSEMRQVLEETLDDSAVLDYLLYKCTALQSADRCHRAFVFTQCFWDKLDQHPQPEEAFFYNLEDVD